MFLCHEGPCSVTLNFISNPIISRENGNILGYHASIFVIFFLTGLEISHRIHFCVLECTLMQSKVRTARRTFYFFIFFFGWGGGGGSYIHEGSTMLIFWVVMHQFS